MDEDWYKIGVLAGDGSVRRGKCIEIQAKDKEMIEPFSSNPTRRTIKNRWNDAWYAYVNDRDLGYWMAEIRNNPSKLIKIPMKNQVRFIAGFFDAEGSVFFYPKGDKRSGNDGAINFSQPSNKELLKVIKEILQTFGIESTLKSVNLALTIHKFWNLRKFNDLIPFKIRRKRERLEKIIEIKRESNQKYWAESEVEFLKEVYDKLSYREIGKILSRDKDSVANKAMRLELGKAPEKWQESEDEYLKNNYHKKTARELSEEMSRRSMDSIYKRAQFLGLSG